jgi:VCBS repeat-containing protein
MILSFALLVALFSFNLLPVSALSTPRTRDFGPLASGDPPTCNDGSLTTNEDQSSETAPSCNDPESDPLTFAIVDNATHGTASVTAEGNLSYTPDADYYGTDSFTYKANDGTTDSLPATVTVTVNPVNDAPSFTPGSDQTVAEDAGPQSVSWATNISAGPPNESGQSISFTVTNNNNPLFSAQPAISPSGTLTYTPAANANGSATVTVTLKDNGGTANGGVDQSAPVHFTITVTPVNDPPTSADHTVTTSEDTDKIFASSDFPFSDIDGDALSQIQITTLESAGSLYLDSNANGIIDSGENITLNQVIANADLPKLKFKPAPDANGSPYATFGFKVHDGTAYSVSAYTMTIIVTPVNDPPTLNAISDPAPIDEDAGLQTVNLSGITAGGGESQTLQVTATTNNNSLLPSLTVNYTSPNATGSLSYTPAPNRNGSAVITVTVRDAGLDGTLGNGDDGTFQRTFTVTVTPVNDPPTLDALADLTINEDAPQQTVNLSGISGGPEEGSQPVHILSASGNTSLIPNPTVTYTSPNSTGTLRFTPLANQFGTAEISVRVIDNEFAEIERIFTVTVNPVNDAPSFTPGSDQTVAEDAGPQSVSWATNISAGPPNESGQNLSFTVTNNNTPLFSAQPAISPSGTLTYTPAANANGSATVTVTLKDNGGTANGGVDQSAPVHFTITVTPVNDPPVVAPATFTIPENSAANTTVGTVTYTDPDTGQSHSYAITAGNTNNAFSIDSSGVIKVNNAAALDYETNPSFNLTVSVTDSGSPALSGETTVTINLENIEEPPAAFGKQAPADSATDVSINPTISWLPSNDVTAYEYCYDTTDNNTCDSGIWTSAGQTPSATLSGLSYSTTYYWQVRATNSLATVEADSGDWWTFTTQPLPTFTKTFTSIAVEDGWVLESTETSGKGGSLSRTSLKLLVGDDNLNRQYRSILSFNTDAMPNKAVILSVTLKLKRTVGAGTNPFATHGKLLVDIRKSKFGSTASLELGDFEAAAGITSAAVVSPTPNSEGYYIAHLRPAAFAQVNVMGWTQLRLRFFKDDNDDHGADYVAFFSGNAANAAYRPILEIVYYIP